MELIYQAVPGFLLVIFRISSFFFSSPIFSFRGVPTQFKIGIAFFISLVTFMGLEWNEPIAINGSYFVSVIKEILIGLVLGFTASLFFTIVQVAGSFVDLQMGFMMANLIDPATGAQSPVMSNMKFFIATLLFLALNGHHYLIKALIESYDWVPLSNEFFVTIANGQVAMFLINSFSTMFVLAFQMIAPLIVVLFLVDACMGILARTAPQFNLFVIGLPIKLLIGLVVLLMMIPGLLYLFQNVFTTLINALGELISIVSNGA